MSDHVHIDAPLSVTPLGDIRDRNDKFVASVFGAGLAQKQARSRLFVAAPDLLSAAQLILEAVGRKPDELLDAMAVEALRNAVKKAEGSDQ